MYFSNWHDLLHMSHHGIFVWPVYGVAIVICIWNIWQPLSLKRQAFRRILQYNTSKGSASHPAYKKSPIKDNAGSHQEMCL